MMRRSKYLALACVFALAVCPAYARGQQEMRSATKGSSTPLPITGTSIDSNHNGLDVNVVGGTISGSGGTQYDEDTAHVSGDKLTMAGVVQKTADAALAADGDNTALQVDSNGYLKVNIKAGAGSGGTAMTDDAAFTPATTSITPAGFMFDDVSPDSVNEGDGGVGRMSANRNQYVTIRDAAGNERGLNIDASGNLTANIAGTVTVGSHAVTNAGTFAVQAAQSGTWNIGTVTTLPALPSNQSVNVAQINGVTTTMGNGASGTGVQRVTLADNSTGVVGLNAGTNLIGHASPAATATTTNTLSTCSLQSAAATNSTNCKGSAGNVYLIRAINTTATLYYLRMYDASSAPTCSSATNFKETIPIPASTTGAGVVIPQLPGQAYANGIGFCFTGGGSSTDNTNAATGVYLAILYK